MMPCQLTVPLRHRLLNAKKKINIKVSNIKNVFEYMCVRAQDGCVRARSRAVYKRAGAAFHPSRWNLPRTLVFN